MDTVDAAAIADRTAPSSGDLYVTFTRHDLTGELTSTDYAIIAAVPPITSMDDVDNLALAILANPTLTRRARRIRVVSWQRWEQ